MTRLARALTLGALVGASALAGCGTSSTCAEGTSRGCSCLGGATGTQTCQAGGGGYAACSCTETDAGIVPDAGPLGAPCTADSDCNGGVCLTPTLNSVPGGYCSNTCSTNADCGASGICLPDVVTQPGGAATGACFAGCTTSSDCRTSEDYTCEEGMCFPDCKVPTFFCSAPQVCNADAGYICTAPPLPTATTDAGTLTVFAMGLNNPVSLAQQGATLYIGDSAQETADGGAGSIDIEAETPGSAPAAIESSVTNAGALATDAVHVYWLATGTTDPNTGSYNGDGAVMQATLGGGAITTLAQDLTSTPSAITVDSKNVYYAVSGTVLYGLGPSGVTGSDGAIFSVPIGGGKTTTIASKQATPAGLAVDGTNIYWTNQGTVSPPSGTSSTYAYDNNGVVQYKPLAGGASKIVAGSLPAPQGIVVDSKNVYWVNQGTIGVSAAGTFVVNPTSGSVMQAPIGGATVTTLAMTQDDAYALSVANGSVYWVNAGTSGAGVLNMVPIGGGTSVGLATGLASPTALVVSGTNVFFTEYGSGMDNGELLEFIPTP